MRHLARPTRTTSRLAIGALMAAAMAGPAPALAQTFSSGSTGADGALTPAANATLALPPSGVFNFTTIDIPGGVTVRFTRNAVNTPVTLLATGNVTIAGTLDLSGARGRDASFGTQLGSNGGAGGPGGFDGGSGATGVASTAGGAGLGPGGGGGGVSGGAKAGGGGHAAPGGGPSGGAAYGTAALLPLVGGSGGGGGHASLGATGGGGGGGGGAVVIAASGTLTLTGTIKASGGQGTGEFFQGPGGGAGGSGGAVRLVATTITGNGTIDVNGGTGVTNDGSPGRVRLEAFATTATLDFRNAVPASLSSAPPTSVTLANEPVLRITAVAGVGAPAVPTASLSNPDVVLPGTTTNPVAVALAASNIPVGTPVTVTVKGQTGGSNSATAILTGTVAASAATASVTIPPNQPSVISATASFALVGAAGGPVFVEGREIERVRVSATAGGPSAITYITRAGDEIVVSGR